MKVQKKLSPLLFWLLPCLLFWGNPAWACSCPLPPSIEEAYTSAAGVFLGRVEKISKSSKKKNNKEIQFTILRRFKGLEEIAGEKLYVYTPETGNWCGVSFTEGLDYIVYLEGTPAAFTTSICSRTVFLDSALEEAQTLGKLAEGTSSPPEEQSSKPKKEDTKSKESSSLFKELLQ